MTPKIIPLAMNEHPSVDKQMLLFALQCICTCRLPVSCVDVASGMINQAKEPSVHFKEVNVRQLDCYGQPIGVEHRNINGCPV